MIVSCRHVYGTCAGKPIPAGNSCFRCPRRGAGIGHPVYDVIIYTSCHMCLSGSGCVSWLAPTVGGGDVQGKGARRPGGGAACRGRRRRLCCCGVATLRRTHSPPLAGRRRFLGWCEQVTEGQVVATLTGAAAAPLAPSCGPGHGVRMLPGATLSAD